MESVNLKAAFAVNIPSLQPNYSGARILLTFKQWLIPFHMTFSITLEKVVNSEIGL
jgi:hypothetical protein